MNRNESNYACFEIVHCRPLDVCQYFQISLFLFNKELSYLDPLPSLSQILASRFERRRFLTLRLVRIVIPKAEVKEIKRSGTGMLENTSYTTDPLKVYQSLSAVYAGIEGGRWQRTARAGTCVHGNTRRITSNSKVSFQLNFLELHNRTNCTLFLFCRFLQRELNHRFQCVFQQ